jgi:HD superfamily phosphohydrolase
MMYQDIIHGAIDFDNSNAGRFTVDLLGCPEVQRLRHMRLLNFDVPFVQELATARRYAHAIGTCFLAFNLVKASYLTKEKQHTLIAAALIHDIGIPPYGHLVEAELHRRNSDFSHESLVEEIVYGKYHPTNIYHQIIPSRVLRIASILRKHSLDPDEIIGLVCPKAGMSSPISSDIDLDNIDNVHRMAALLGLPKARSNLKLLTNGIRLTPRMTLAFKVETLEAIQVWLQFRSEIYRIMIAHPECVAYNAFLRDLVSLAISKEIITQEKWFLSDFAFEQALLQNDETAHLASQLAQGCRYRLVDYVWMYSVGSACDPGKSIISQLEQCFTVPPVEDLHYFFWVEKDRISRKVTTPLDDSRVGVLGAGSFTVLVALVSHGDSSQKSIVHFSQHLRASWRDNVVNTINNIAPEWECTPQFPEDFSIGSRAQPDEVQLELF